VSSGPRGVWPETAGHELNRAADLLEQSAITQEAAVFRNTRTGAYHMGIFRSMSRLIAAHVATGAYASGVPRRSVP
jgi:hypothetical protein